MRDSIAIDKTKYKDYIWMVVALFVSRLIWREQEQVFLFVYLGLVLLIVVLCKKIFLPNIIGIYPYMLLIIVLAGIGLVLHKTRYVERDLFYTIPSIILIILGYYFFSMYGEKSIVKTIVLCGLINTVYTLFDFIFRTEGIKELQDLRDYFNAGIYEACLIFLVLAIFVFNSQTYVFGKIMDIVVLAILLVQIIFSMSRSVWIEIIVGVPVVIIINLFFNSKKSGTYIKSILIVFLAIVGVAALYTYAPPEILEDYNSKVENTSDELNDKQEFNSTEDAMKNWRAYENQCAINQWKGSSSVVQVFGAGLGKGTYIQFVPYSWEGLDEEHTIPLLHNGFYTMLSKGGIVGVALLIFFLLYPMIVGLKSLRRRGYSNEATVLVTISIVFALQTYVARGPIAQSPNLAWGLLIGWFCGELKKSEEQQKSQK